MTRMDANGSSELAMTRATHNPARQLWQAPVFVLGVCALLGVALLRPLAGNPTARALTHELSRARHLLHHPDGDAEEALHLLRHALEQSETLPDRTGEVYFLLGTAEMRLGDRAAGTEARLHWQTARQYLVEADKDGVPEKDQAVLQFRLGKVGCRLGDDPRQVVERLAAHIEAAGDKLDVAEGLSVLTEAYEHLPQPDLRAALAANERLRDLPGVPEEMLAPARLKGGELLLKLNRPEEARKTFERVGAKATPGVLARSRILRGHSFQDEGRWTEAAAQWNAVLADTPAGSADRSVVLYHLGVCYQKLEQPREALRCWEECQVGHPGDEGRAAMICLADLSAQEPTSEKALQLLMRAVAPLQKPEDWKNSLLSLTRVRGIFERILASYRQAGQFEPALKVLEAYQHLAVPGRLAQLRAETTIDWAHAHREKAGKETAPEVKGQEEQLAHDLLCQAGRAYEQTAESTAQPVEKANLFWLSAACYREAPSPSQLVDVLTSFLKINDRPERQGEGWFQVAETLRQGQKSEAEEAYLNCMKCATPPFARRAQYQVALSQMERGEFDSAEATLEQNLQLLRYEPDSEAHDKTLYALGGLFFQRRKYNMVVRKLEEAIQKFPSNPDNTRARFQLAESYRQLGSQVLEQSVFTGSTTNPLTRDHYNEEYRRLLKHAAEHYGQLAKDLEKPEIKSSLSDKEALQIPFIAAECLFNLGEYQEALASYDRLATNYAGKIEGLKALGGAVRCHSALEQFDKMKQRLNDIQAALTPFDASTRQVWESWLQACRDKETKSSKPVVKPGQ
jgi:tetratricopeptide (TPR) repeat protein